MRKIWENDWKTKGFRGSLFSNKATWKILLVPASNASISQAQKKLVLHIAEAGDIAGFHLEFQIKVLQLFPHALEVVS